MITGDNPLTACHVAKELRMTRRPHTLILKKTQENGEKNQDLRMQRILKKIFCSFLHTEGDWRWESIYDNIVEELKDFSKVQLRQFLKKYDICLTGEVPYIKNTLTVMKSPLCICYSMLQGLSHLVSNNRKLLMQILPHVAVFARVAPKQKEFVVTSLKEIGYYTLMCGDGTNDVGALKHAHVGK